MRFGRWYSERDDRTWTPERCQPWPMISFCHHGAYLAVADGAQVVVDGNTLLWLRRGACGNGVGVSKKLRDLSGIFGKSWTPKA